LESLKSSKIKNFESKPIISSSESSISAVIEILKSNDAYEVFIEDRGKVGVITIRDILKASDLPNMKASSLVTSVSKILPDDTVARAARLMSDYRLRSLPIVEQRAIDGAVTAQSLCRALLLVRKFDNVAIYKIMKKKLITINKNESVVKARSLMVDNNIDHLPVLDSGKLCGILVSNQIVFSMSPKQALGRDITFHDFHDRRGFSDWKVSGLMDPNPLVSALEEKATEVLKRLIDERKTYSVVKLWDELQGIVTYRDFIVFLAEPEKLDIPVYMVGLPDDSFEAELAKAKFIREAATLKKSSPKIEEIRATIKSEKASNDKHRYEVKVSIIAAGKINSYSEEGWNISAVFDEISSKMKRLLTQKPERKQEREREES